MSFQDYLQFAEKVGITKEDREFEKWQKEIANKKFQNPVLEELKKIIYRENRNAIILLMGVPGSGKSYLTLKLSETFDPTFSDSLENRVIFDKDTFFYRLLDYQIPLKKGNVIVMEELGVQADTKNWYDFSQKAFSYILQTFRYRNLAVIFNTPYIDLVESRIIDFVNYIIEVVPVDRTNDKMKNINKWRAWRIKKNALYGIIPGISKYKIEPFYENDTKIEWLFTTSPSDKSLEKYEILSREWKTKLNFELLKEIMLRYDKTGDTGKRMEKILDEIFGNINKYTKMRGKNLILLDAVVQQDFKLLPAEVKLIKQLFEREQNTKRRIKDLTNQVEESFEMASNRKKDEIEEIIEEIFK